MRGWPTHALILGILGMVFGALLCGPNLLWANETDEERPIGVVGGAVHADLFTRTATTSIPIEVPPCRQGLQPELALVYGSTNGNGWVGMGWKLEKGVIERQSERGATLQGSHCGNDSDGKAQRNDDPEVRRPNCRCIPIHPSS